MTISTIYLDWKHFQQNCVHQKRLIQLIEKKKLLLKYADNIKTIFFLIILIK